MMTSSSSISWFYNRLLKCFVLIELKTSELTHQDLGQLQMYVNYYDRKEKLPEDNKTILAAEYKLRLPSEEQLLAEVRKATEEYEEAKGSEAAE